MRVTVVFTLALLAGCSTTKQQAKTQGPSSKSSSTNEPVALVRFVEGVPGSGHIDLWFGNSKVFSDTAYKDATPYVEVPAQRRDFQVRSTSDSTPGATTSESLDAGVHYTVVAAPAANSSVRIYLMPDDLTTPPAGQAKMRVIDATADNEKLAVVVPSGELFSGIESNSSSKYKNLPAGIKTIEIRRTARKADALRIPDFNVEPSRIYTIVIVGGGGRPLDALPLTDQQTRMPTGD